jgi:hypothetical protein
MKRTAHFPFRWVLPIAQLVLCRMLLWPWKGAFLLQLRSAAHARWPTTVEAPTFRITTPIVPPTPGDRSTRTIADLRLTTPALLNMPSGFVGLAHRASVRKGMLPDFWRAMSWPFVGLIFWWIVGRGIEALGVSRSRVVSPAITWVETVTALLVSFFAGSLFVGLMVDPSMRSDFIFPWQLAILACGFWTFLGAVTVLARLLQWWIKRRLRADAREEAVPA